MNTSCYCKESCVHKMDSSNACSECGGIELGMGLWDTFFKWHSSRWVLCIGEPLFLGFVFSRIENHGLMLFELV
jgi:hypothetical protein